VVRYATEAVNVDSTSTFHFKLHSMPFSETHRILFPGFFPQIMFVSQGMKKEMARAVIQ